MKQATVKIFLVAISLLCISCENEVTEPDHYNVSVYNGYFETIDTLRVDTSIFISLKVDSCTEAIIFNKGVYPILVHTESELLIKAEIKLQGENPDLTLKINTNGDISIE